MAKQAKTIIMSEEELHRILHDVLTNFKETIEVPNVLVRKPLLVPMHQLTEFIGMNKRYLKKALAEGIIKPGYYLNSETKTELFDPEEVIEQIKQYNSNIKISRK